MPNKLELHHEFQLSQLTLQTKSIFDRYLAKNTIYLNSAHRAHQNRYRRYESQQEEKKTHQITRLHLAEDLLSLKKEG